MAAKSLILLGLCVLVIGYIGHVEYPEPCDYPVTMKAYYSLMRLITTTVIKYLLYNFDKCAI